LSKDDSYLDESEFTYLFWLYEAFRKIRNVPGHIVEVGVARGRNSIVFGNLIKLRGEGSTRRYFGFDTFSGYTEEDIRSSPHLSGDHWKDNSKAFVDDRLKRQGLEKICTIIEGDVKETGPEFIAKKGNMFQANSIAISMLYIDCNAYLPAITSLNLFGEHMSPGGIICIDEKMQGGETKALAEYCRAKQLPFLRDEGPFSMPAYTVAS
jgi:hypothetical protein